LKRYTSDSRNFSTGQVLGFHRAVNKQDDPLWAWIKDAANKKELLPDEAVDPDLVNTVVKVGYADDLTDDESEEVGRGAILSKVNRDLGFKTAWK